MEAERQVEGAAAAAMERKSAPYLLTSLEDPAAAVAAETAVAVAAAETAAAREAGERCGWQRPTSVSRETEYRQ